MNVVLDPTSRSVTAAPPTPAAGSRLAVGPAAAPVLAVALMLGWAAEGLFYGRALGVSVPLFVLLLLAALFGLGRLAKSPSASRYSLWLLPPLLFLAAMAAVRASAPLTALNLLGAAGLLGLVAFFHRGVRSGIERLPLLGYAAALGLIGADALTAAAAPAAALTRRAVGRGRRSTLVVPLARGGLLALPIVLVFALLLASADTVFALRLESLLRLGFLSDLPELLGRTAIALAVAWLCAGGLLGALRPPGSDDGLPGRLAPGRRIGAVEAAVVLGALDLLFAGFVWIQVRYLFGGVARLTMDYEAYREYVRRGFGELLLAAFLAMTLILWLRWIGRGDARTLRTLASLTIVLVGVILASAYWRMVIWEDVEYYISTPLRLFVRWSIVWLGVAFAWLLVTLWTRPERFPIGAFAALVGFVVTMNVIDPDAAVAAHNLRRNDELSVRFVDLLSDDAVPALAAGLDTTTGETRARLRAHLAGRLAHLEVTRQADDAPGYWGGWPSWHLARLRAYAVLSELRRQGRI
ncbi:MAG TPA: DUF4173 domain-containing protein [Chloroflexota bacterium]|nr:DUF4173 domain-containing protein [Chloroflexota bacterium]